VGVGGGRIQLEDILFKFIQADHSIVEMAETQCLRHAQSGGGK